MAYIDDELQQKVLRIGQEPYAYFDERQVHRLLTENPAEYYRFMRDELADIAAGRAQLELPPKQVFSDSDSASDFRVMPCVVRRPGSARKTVKLVGTNTWQQLVPDQITVGKAFVLHPQENFVSHVFEACLLSSARTGLCAAIAIDVLSRSRENMAFVGAGRVGYYAAFYAATLGGGGEISFFDKDYERARQTAALLTQQIPSVSFTAIREIQQASDADVLVLATTSTEPICHPHGTNANLIVSLGADTDYQRELDPAWAKVADIFVDTLDCARFGDLNSWQDDGLIDTAKLVDLFQLLRAGEPCDTNRPRVFVSTGSALFDNLTIGYLLAKSPGF
jgi:ornithine cyclodeaminase/alanine dehydrogenase-like protein (mu-crystallin family)